MIATRARQSLATALLAVSMLLPVQARADDGAWTDADQAGAPEPGGPSGDDPGDAAYYLDASAFIFYGASLGYLATALFMEPSASPRWFPASEGGAEYRGSTVPDWTLGVFAGVTATTIAALPGRTRWYHFKGFLGSVAATGFATELAKNVYGRHRPDYQPGHPDAGTVDGRKSFFSGHSSLTLVSTTYLALYLHDHVFPDLRRDPDSIPWWEVASYTGLVAFSVYVPLSRVQDNRHNPSDVLTGSAVGMVAAIGFYRWQEYRARGTRSLDGAVRQPRQASESPRRPSLVLMPSTEPFGLSMSGQF